MFSLKTTAIAALLPFLAAAAPAPVATTSSAAPAATESTVYFTGLSARSASPVHLLSITASQEKFWLNGPTTTLCPESVEPYCPPGNTTVFGYGYGAVGLSIEVPGGQNPYFDPSGAFMFTIPHSGYTPPDSALNSLTYSKTEGATFGEMSTTAFGAQGFMACPTVNSTVAAYQVFAAINNATVPTGNVADCYGFDALAVDYTGPTPAAWEYI